ncbi:MAG: HEAT repeat domain-containing protein [Nitrospirae bacterium]|nr:HEAT repeat domain-containing protein [Nitrospirota bacterium]
MNKIRDTDSAMRCDAIRMITGMKDARVLYPLIKSLQDDDRGVQQAAMDALIGYDDEAAVYNLIPLLYDRRVAVKNLAQEILEKTGRSGLGLLHSHIHDMDEDVRKMIADIIGRLEIPEAVPVLIEMLKDQNDNVRSSAIEGLGRITDQSIVDHLINLLEQEDWIILFAVESLGRLGDARAVKPIVKLLMSSQNIDIQCMAIDALSQIGGKESIDGLLEIIDAVKPEIMDIAVMGIVTLTQGDISSIVDMFGRDKFVMHLVRFAENTDNTEEGNIKNILQAFMTIGGSGCAKEVLRLIEKIDGDNPDLVNKAVEVVKVVSNEETLIASLKYKNQNIRLISIRALGLTGSEKAISTLSLLFDEVERDLKYEILNAIGNIGGEKALSFISARLSDDEGHIRGAAADALGSFESIEIIKPLLNRLQTEEYHNVIGKVVGALIETGQRYMNEELAEGLLSSLNSKNPSVREMVVRGLGKLKWIDSAELISGLLNDENWRVRRASLEALNSGMNKNLIENLIIAAHDEIDEVRMIVAQLLSDYTEDMAKDELIELLEDNNYRIQLQAIEGLVKQNAVHAVPIIMKLAGSNNNAMRKTALWALGELGAQESEDILRGAVSDEDLEIQEMAKSAYHKLVSLKYADK